MEPTPTSTTETAPSSASMAIPAPKLSFCPSTRLVTWSWTRMGLSRIRMKVSRWSCCTSKMLPMLTLRRIRPFVLWRVEIWRAALGHRRSWCCVLERLSRMICSLGSVLSPHLVSRLLSRSFLFVWSRSGRLIDVFGMRIAVIYCSQRRSTKHWQGPKTR